jgi:outer membrane protein TolC
MPPTVGAGFFMTPYNAKLWQRDGDMLGMGSVAVSVEQMFPNRKKLNANENLMKAMSAVEKEKLYAALNENFQDAKKLYYSSIVLDKKLKVVKENEKMLDFMIRNAEIRYKNGLSKISAYYKAKAEVQKWLMYENDLRVNRIRLNAPMGRDAFAPLEIEPEYNLNDYSRDFWSGSLLSEQK